MSVISSVRFHYSLAGCHHQRYEKDTTCSKVFTGVQIFQNELVVEIDFKSLFRAIGKVLRMKFTCPAKCQLLVLFVSIIV